MIYLFGSGAFKTGEKAVKVGFTDNKKERETAYGLHNPLGEFIAWREGDRELEAKLHMRLVDHKESFLDEWFYWEPGVEEAFNETEEEIDKWIWERKYDVLFDSGCPFPGTMKRRILDKLRSKFEEKPTLIEKNLGTINFDVEEFS